MSHVLVERVGRVGYLTLARSAALNALDRDMIDALAHGLEAHVANGEVELLVIRSREERAFCAGGDMRRARELVLTERFDELDAFFAAEYALNLAIARCPKPYVALIDGIAMGGGLGLSVHGSHRVVTERAVLAMPEVKIGFFPDVGASFFLPRLPGRAGRWLGLTGDSVRAELAVLLGLATHHVKSSALPALLRRLEHDASESVDDVLEKACAVVALDEPMLEFLRRRGRWFVADTAEAIDETLGEAAPRSEEAGQLLRTLRAASPHSVRTTLELFEGNEERSLAEALEREREFACEAVRHPDFTEGIRAVLVDRRPPRWERSTGD